MKEKNTMRLLSGVVVAHLTPFGGDGAVDYHVLEEYIHFLAEKGVNGLFVCGTTAEAQLLTLEERKRVLEAVLAANNGKMTIVAHCGTVNFPDTHELLAHARHSGADGGAVVTPFYYRYSQEELYAYYALLAEDFPDFPLYLYNIPGLTGNDMAVSTVSRLQERFPNIVGLKDSSGNFTTVSGYLLALPRTFRVIVGYDRGILPALLLGGAGTVTGPGGVVPEPFVNLWKAFERGDYEEAASFQKEITTISILLKEGAHLPTLKMGLALRGFGEGTMRFPFKKLSEAQTAELREDLEKTLEKFGYHLRVSG
jgi:4-hydroxy-tetrahydrodipicolinate synthase